MAKDIFEEEIDLEETESVFDPTVDEYSTEGPLSSEDIESIDKEIALEEKYGDSGVRAAVESAISSATFGLSDQGISALGPEYQEALRERRERNEGEALFGEITGIAGPLLLSGGTSLLGRGIAKVGLGLKGAAKVGKGVENLTTKGLNKLFVTKGKETFAKDVLKKGIAKGSGSAVEGTFFGVGELIEENALGRADLNAENLMAYGGQGALWGGLIGGGLGSSMTALGKSAELVIPKIKGNKVTGFVVKKIKDFKSDMFNPTYNAYKLGGFSHTKIVDMIEKTPEVVNNLPPILQKIMRKTGLGALTSNKTLYKNMLKYIDETGENIGNSIHEIQQKYGNNVYMFPTKSQMAKSIIGKLDDLKKKRNLLDDEGLPKKTDDAISELRRIDTLQKKYMDDLLNNKPLNAVELQRQKVDFFKRSDWKFTGEKVPLTAEINRTLGDAFKGELYKVSHKVAPSLGKELRQNLLDYRTASGFISNFGKKIDQEKFLFDRDLFFGAIAGGFFDMLAPAGAALALKAFAKSDLKNKIAILSSIEKANVKVKKKVQKDLSDYFKRKTISEGVVSMPVGLLVTSPLAQPIEIKDDNSFKDSIVYKKPKTDNDAIRNISRNIDEVKKNPKYLKSLATNINFQASAPETFKSSQSVLVRSLGFLDSKLPGLLFTVDINPFFKKHHDLSHQEIYKFKKYLRAVEDPLSILDDFKRGTLSRESIDAVKFVYPNFYEEIHSTAYDEMSKLGREGKLEYKQRLQLNILMDIPTDNALVPESIAEFQKFYKEAQVSQAGGTVSASAAKQMDFSESQATELEKISNRRDLGRS